MESSVKWQRAHIQPACFMIGKFDFGGRQDSLIFCR